MPVILFQPRFHDAVRSGTKRQTIRLPRKRPIRPGDPLSLRAWSGKPYRSKQTILGFGVCMAADQITIDLYFDDDAEAKRDGFDDAREMIDWFIDNHGMPTPTQPFVGTRIVWR